MKVSSPQHLVHAPQQSPFLLLVLSSSQTIKAENTDILDKKSMIIPNPAKRQKLERASKEDVQPRKKAMAFVTEVIVTEEPACIIPSLILSFTGFLGSV
jgi:hypothetical protein